MVPLAHLSHHLDQLSQFMHALPPKLPLPVGVLGPMSLGPITLTTPNGTSIASAAFTGFTSVTNRQADRLTDRMTHATLFVPIGP